MQNQFKESQFWWGDTLINRLGQEDGFSGQAVALFHGFPGQPPPGEEEKYRGKPKLRLELAKAIFADLGWDAYLPGYEGLGESRGKYSFERSIERSVDFARSLLDRGYSRLHLIGHSWGAFVAVNVSDGLGYKAGKVVLMSGLLDLPDIAAVKAFLPYYVGHYPNIFGTDHEALNRAVIDLDSARRRFNPMNRTTLPAESESLLTIYSRNDIYVNPKDSRRFQKRFGGSILAVDDDHVFSSDMPSAVRAVAEFLAGRPPTGAAHS